MAKTSRKLGMRHEKSRGGCLWGLMCKLHLHEGRSNWKLLLDKGRGGHGKSRSSLVSVTTNDVNMMDKTERGTNIAKPRVKTLMEEEMIIEAKAESRQRNYQRKSTRHGKTKPKERYNWVTENSEQSCIDDDQQSFTDDIRDFLECLGSLFRRRNGIQGEYDEEKLSQSIGEVLTQQLLTGRQLTEGEKIQRSKAYLNMLRILNSSKSSLLDPEVMSMKIMDVSHGSQLGRNLSKKAVRIISPGREEGEAMSSRIVILKPSMNELQKPGKALTSGVSLEIDETHCTKVQNRKLAPPRFLSDIKRKLRKIVAKECPDLHSGTFIEQAGIEIEDTCKDDLVNVSHRTRKYLSEAITAEHEDLSQHPGVRGMILFYPELNCIPCTSPGRSCASRAVSPPTGCAKRRKSDGIILTGSGPVIMSSSADGGIHDVVKEWREKEQQMSHEVPSSELSLIVEEGHEDPEVITELPDRPSPVSVLEAMFSDDDISPAVVRRGMLAQTNRPADLPPSTSSVEYPTQTLEIEFEEDDICIAEVDDHVRTFQEDGDSVLKRVRALLRASYLKWDDLYFMSQGLGRLIESPILHDQHVFEDDAELLVDCVNEAISEACNSFIGRSCLSLVKQRIKPLPSMNFTIHEVCREMKWHLNPIPLPRSLEQIVAKDLSRQLSWMDLTYEGESIGFEVCERILSELLQDIIVTAEEDIAGQLRIHCLS